MTDMNEFVRNSRLNMIKTINQLAVSGSRCVHCARSRAGDTSCRWARCDWQSVTYDKNKTLPLPACDIAQLAASLQKCILHNAADMERNAATYGCEDEVHSLLGGLRTLAGAPPTADRLAMERADTPREAGRETVPASSSSSSSAAATAVAAAAVTKPLVRETGGKSVPGECDPEQLQHAYSSASAAPSLSTKLPAASVSLGELSASSFDTPLPPIPPPPLPPPQDEDSDACVDTAAMLTGNMDEYSHAASQAVDAVVSDDYVASVDDELSVTKGDRVRVLFDMAEDDRCMVELQSDSDTQLPLRGMVPVGHLNFERAFESAVSEPAAAYVARRAAVP